MKKNSTLSKLMGIVLMAIFPLSMFGQNAEVSVKTYKQPVEKYFYLFADGGASIYHGDLARYGFKPDMEHIKLNGNIGLGYQFGGVVGMNLKLGMGAWSGEKHNTNFYQVLPVEGVVTPNDLYLTNSRFYAGNLNLTFNIFNLFKYNPRRVFNFIPHIGVGAVMYKGETATTSELNSANGEQSMQTVYAADKHDFALAVPVGAELNFNVSPKVDIFVDYTFNWAGNDNLDYVSKGENETHQVINDMFTSLNLGLRYKFNDPCNIEKMANEAGTITMRAIPEVLVEKDGMVDVTVEVTIPEKYFEKKAIMNLTPVISYEGGSVKLNTMNFKGEKVKGGDAMTVNYKKGGTFTYTTSIPYDPAMETCQLSAAPMFYKYDGTIYATEDDIAKNTYFTQAPQRKLADGTTVTTKEPEPEPELEPEPEPEPEPVADFVFFFQKNSHVIMMNNSLNKEAVNILKEKLQAGDIKGFTIQGWASPEGELNYNENLAVDRANAAAASIKKTLKQAKLNDKDFTFECVGNGPDWETFLTELEKSNIKDKEAIINVIRSGNQAEKENEIKNMILIYPELEKEILPTLRRAEVFIQR